MRTTIPAYVWGLALGLWSGCDFLPAALPQCADGMALGTDEHGQLACVTAPPLIPGTASMGGECTADQALGSFGTPTQIRCLDKRTGTTDRLEVQALRQHLANLQQAVDAVTTSLAQLRELQQKRRPHYVGTTRALTTGRITLNGQSGLLAATALCTAEFGAGAQMCTSSELAFSVYTGKLRTTERIAPAWIYMPTWHNPHGSTLEPNAGLADNCGGYTTADDTTGYTGATVEWAPLASGDVAFRWHGGDEALCSASFPIACCQRVLP